MYVCVSFVYGQYGLWVFLQLKLAEPAFWHEGGYEQYGSVDPKPWNLMEPHGISVAQPGIDILHMMNTIKIY